MQAAALVRIGGACAAALACGGSNQAWMTAFHTRRTLETSCSVFVRLRISRRALGNC
jgi:hypothetical protein